MMATDLRALVRELRDVLVAYCKYCDQGRFQEAGRRGCCVSHGDLAFRADAALAELADETAADRLRGECAQVRGGRQQAWANLLDALEKTLADTEHLEADRDALAARVRELETAHARYDAVLKQRAEKARVYSDHQTAEWLEKIRAEVGALLRERGPEEE